MLYSSTEHTTRRAHGSSHMPGPLGAIELSTAGSWHCLHEQASMQSKEKWPEHHSKEGRGIGCHRHGAHTIVRSELRRRVHALAGACRPVAS